jgi:hypothetical protein
MTKQNKPADQMARPYIKLYIDLLTRGDLDLTDVALLGLLEREGEVTNNLNVANLFRIRGSDIALSVRKLLKKGLAVSDGPGERPRDSKIILVE